MFVFLFFFLILPIQCIMNEFDAACLGFNLGLFYLLLLFKFVTLFSRMPGLLKNCPFFFFIHSTGDWVLSPQMKLLLWNEVSTEATAVT